jgi:WD40 repeat protein
MSLRAARLAALALLAALAACASDDARSLVAVDVTLGADVVVDRVDLTVAQDSGSGASVVQSFLWTEASAGVLRAGLYLPAAVTGGAILRARGFLGANAVAQAVDAPFQIAHGERTGPIPLILVRSAIFGDGGAPDAGPDTSNDAAATDTEPGADGADDVADDLTPGGEPDAGADVTADLAPDLTPDLGPDAPPAPPSLINCKAYTHITGTCDTNSGVGDWAVGSVHFSPDGKFVVSGGQDGRSKVWKVTSTGLVPDGRVYGGSGTMRVDFSPDGVYLAVTSRNGPLTLIDFARNAMLGDLVGHAGQVYAIAWAPDSTALASVDDMGVVKLWDVTARAATKTVMLGGVGWDIAVAPQGPAGTLWAAVAMSSGGVVYLLDLKAATVMPLPFVVGGPNSNARTVTFSPDGATLAVGTSDGDVSFWDVTNKQQVTKIGPPIYTSTTQLPWEIVFSNDGRHVAMAWAGEGGVVLTSTTQQPRKLGGSFVPEWIPISVAFSPDGLAIVAGEYRCGQLVYCKD